MRLKKRTCERGVTLPEILVVIAILAILAFVSGTWLLAHAGRADLKRATRNLVTSLHFAKNEAIKQNTSFEVAVDNNGWSVVQTKTGTAHQRFNTSNLRTQINVTSNKNRFVFTGKGRPTPNSLGTVTLRIPGGEKLEVTVSMAGNIRVK